MKNKKVCIIEEGIDCGTSRNMILNVLDSQINNYKLQYLMDWEGNHSISPLKKNKKIEALRAEKDEILGIYRALDTNSSLIDVNISIDLTIKELEKSEHTNTDNNKVE